MLVAQEAFANTYRPSSDGTTPEPEPEPNIKPAIVHLYHQTHFSDVTCFPAPITSQQVWSSHRWSPVSPSVHIWGQWWCHPWTGSTCPSPSPPPRSLWARPWTQTVPVTCRLWWCWGAFRCECVIRALGIDLSETLHGTYWLLICSLSLCVDVNKHGIQHSCNWHDISKSHKVSKIRSYRHSGLETLAHIDTMLPSAISQIWCADLQIMNRMHWACCLFF